MINRAREIIEEITREAEVGQTYQATVKRIEKYGAFVGLFPGKDALLHISQISKIELKSGRCLKSVTQLKLRLLKLINKVE